AHTAREIAKTEGLFVGYTSGAVMQAIKQLNEEERFKPEDKVVIIFPDHGSRYMSKIFSDDWMAEQGFFDSKNEVTIKTVQYIS
ncbi:MAG: cystathionine beta-synthase, partial [Bacteroidia bacterium]|nr:cystathionine beta-synthase [Bacteroidia bacterium]